MEESDTYIQQAYAKKSHVCRYIERHPVLSTLPIASADTVSQASTGPSASTSTTSSDPKTIALPKLQLPTFSGDILTWVSFYDAFRSAVHDNKCLQDIQKFQYLRGLLTDEAAHTIEGLSLTGANYSHALQLLRDRYGQEHKIIDAYMRALWQIQKPNGDLSSLHRFYDTLESYIRGLKSLGKEESSYGELLVPIIMDKLSVNTRKQIARDHGDVPWTLPDLRKALLKEINAIQAGLTVDTDTMGESTSQPALTVYFSRQLEIYTSVQTKAVCILQRYTPVWRMYCCRRSQETNGNCEA
ncbi:uncharacterized protein [Ptychodera flava]|uniref:uncharacterized protein n=1 Tax=Ptychodera flava TaxID=63121 RepID=UPI00396A541D